MGNTGKYTAATKKKLNYRRGDKFRNCGNCAEFVENHPIFHIGANEPHRFDGRCEPVGMGNSIRYHIAKDQICDRHRPKWTE